MALQPLVDRINAMMREAATLPGCPWTMPVLTRKPRTMAEVREFGSAGPVPYPAGHEDKPYGEEWLKEIEDGLRSWLAEAKSQDNEAKMLAELQRRALTVMTADELDVLLGSMAPRG